MPDSNRNIACDPSIHIIECDDWVAVYRDGVRVHQNHSCSLREGLQALSMSFTCEYIEDDPREVDLSDRFPKRLG